MINKGFYKRVLGNTDYKQKKRLNDYMKFEGAWYTVLQVLKHDPIYVWDSFKANRIHLTSNSEKMLEETMKKDHALKYNIYHKNKREKKARNEKILRIATQAGVDISKVHLKT